MLGQGFGDEAPEDGGEVGAGRFTDVAHVQAHGRRLDRGAE